MIFLPMPFLHAFSLIYCNPNNTLLTSPVYLARVQHYPFDLGHQCCNPIH